MMKKTSEDVLSLTDFEIKALRQALELKSVEIRIASGSMEPVLKVGGRYNLEKVSIQDLRRFDIIVFRRGQILIAHYVWHVNRHFDKGHIITRSLIPGGEDLPILPSDVFGRVQLIKIPSWTRLRLIVDSIFFR
jgi:hypothetical protein